MEQVSSNYYEELYITRLVILLEHDPFGNKYHQIMLTPEQFNQFSSLIWSFMPEKANGKKTIQVVGGRELISLPDDMQEFYDKDNT